MGSEIRQKPADDRAASSWGEMWKIATHPAFRIGFLDACSGRPPNHDSILQRIETETPAGALVRLGWTSLFAQDVRVAQERYEEGRILHVAFGLRCKAWGHPDFPPASVRSFIEAAIAKQRDCRP